MSIQKLNCIIKEMLETHKGGHVFFDNLDKALQDESILDLLIEKIPENKSIAVSGKFGLFFMGYYYAKFKTDKNIIYFPGGLRNNNPEILIPKNHIEGRKFIFIDDSFYLGRTRDKIKEYIESNGWSLYHTFVIYDGSRNLDLNVSSLYRYYWENLYRKI